MGITADLATANEKLDGIKTDIADLKTAIANSPAGDNAVVTEALANVQTGVDTANTKLDEIKNTL